MHDACVRSLVFCLALVGALVFTAPAVAAPNKCDSGKLQCMRKKALCILKVYEKAIKKGEPTDGEKLLKCRSKFEGPEKGCVAKVEAKQNFDKPETVCTVVGNTATMETVVDECVMDFLAGVAQGGQPNPTPTPTPTAGGPTPTPSCGNGVREGAEECDGTDDDFCPGGCLSGCTCPVCCVDSSGSHCFFEETAADCEAVGGVPGNLGEYACTDQFGFWGCSDDGFESSGCCEYSFLEPPRRCDSSAGSACEQFGGGEHRPFTTCVSGANCW